MLRFILRRLAIIPLALLLINFLGYTYAHIVLPLRAAKTPYLARMPEPGPLLPNYFTYLGKAIRLDLGTMPVGQAGRTLTEVFGQAVVASGGLLLIALTLSVAAGLFVGLRSARTDPPRPARWLVFVSTLGLAMPSFYIGSLFILGIFFYILQIPGSGMPLPLFGYGWDQHLVLPVLALMVRPTVQLAQVTSSLLVEELGKQYVVAARSFGSSWVTVRRRHVLRNALAQVILSIAGSLRLLVGELILVEWLFQWPGLGYLFALTLIPPATSSGMNTTTVFLNPPIVATVLTILAAIFLLTDLAASVLVRAIDPRLRAPEEEVAGNV